MIKKNNLGIIEGVLIIITIFFLLKLFLQRENFGGVTGTPTKPPKMKNSSTKKPSLTPTKPPEMKNSSCIHHKYHYNNYYNADSYYWICKNDFNNAANDIIKYSYYTSNQDIKLVDNSKCIKNNAHYYFS